MVAIQKLNTRALGLQHVDDDQVKLSGTACCRKAAFDMYTIGWRCETRARLVASYVVPIYLRQDKALSYERKNEETENDSVRNLLCRSTMW